MVVVAVGDDGLFVMVVVAFGGDDFVLALALAVWQTGLPFVGVDKWRAPPVRRFHTNLAVDVPGGEH